MPTMPLTTRISASATTTHSKETSLGSCITLSMILFLLGLALPVAFSLSSTISQVIYCDLCLPKNPKAAKEVRYYSRLIFWCVILMYLIVSAVIYALVFTQLEDIDSKAKRGLLASVAAFIGTMGLEVFVAMGVCVVIKHRHVIEEGERCRRYPEVVDEVKEEGEEEVKVEEEAIPRVDSHQVEEAAE